MQPLLPHQSHLRRWQRLIFFRRRSAAQYQSPRAYVRSLAIVSGHRCRYPLRRWHVGFGESRAPQTRPCRRRTERALRIDRPRRKRVASSLRLEPLGWTSDASCSSFDAVGDLSGTTRRCGKSERRDRRPRAALVEQQRPTTQGHRDTCAKMILWQSGPRVRKYKIPCS